MGSKILNIIKKIEDGILFLFLAVILLACFFQVIGRYTPLPFSSAFEEIAVNLFIWMTLLGAGVCYILIASYLQAMLWTSGIGNGINL